MKDKIKNILVSLKVITLIPIEDYKDVYLPKLNYRNPLTYFVFAFAFVWYICLLLYRFLCKFYDKIRYFINRKSN